MNIELVIDGKTKHVQFQNPTGIGCLLSDSPIPGTGYGGRREVTRQQIQMISYGYRSVERGDQANMLDGRAATIDSSIPVEGGDVLTITERMAL